MRRLLAVLFTGVLLLAAPGVNADAGDATPDAGPRPGVEDASGTDRPRVVMVMKRLPADALSALMAGLEAGFVTAQTADHNRWVVLRLRQGPYTDVIQRLGLEDGDIVLRVNDLPVRSAEAASELLRQTKPTADVQLMIRRGEVLRAYNIGIERAAPVLPDPPVRTEASAAPAHAGDGATVLNEAELEAEWAATDYVALAMQAAPELVRDTNGAVRGVTSAAFDAIPLARKLGLRSGDLIESVNGMPIDSEQAIFNIVERLQGETSFAVGIRRGGKPVTLRYRIE